MPIPTQPTIPRAPDRQRPSTFAADADAWVAAFGDFATYLRELADFVSQQADAANAAAIAGNLSSLDLQNMAGFLIAVNSAGDGVEGRELDYATDSENGVVQLATEDEALAENATRVLTGETGAALIRSLAVQEVLLWENNSGLDIASAQTVTLGDDLDNYDALYGIGYFTDTNPQFDGSQTSFAPVGRIVNETDGAEAAILGAAGGGSGTPHTPHVRFNSVSGQDAQVSVEAMQEQTGILHQIIGVIFARP